MDTAPDARALLDCALLAVDSNFEALRQLFSQHNSSSSKEQLLRILLTFLPESTSPASYTTLVQDVLHDRLSALDQTEALSRPSQGLSDAVIRRRVRKLSLNASADHSPSSLEDDLLCRLLLPRARAIDRETGSLDLVHSLIELFTGQSPSLTIWFTSTLLPLMCMTYDDTAVESDTWNLESFERLRGRNGLQQLLDTGFAARPTAEAKVAFLRAAIEPWIEGRIKQTESVNGGIGSTPDKSDLTSKTLAQDLWQVVNHSIFQLAHSDYLQVARIFDLWDGQESASTIGLDKDSIKRQLLQTALGCVYLNQDTSEEFRQASGVIIDRISTLQGSSDVTQESAQTKLDLTFFEGISRIHLLPSELLDESNPLTDASSAAVELLKALYHTNNTLERFDLQQSLGEVLLLGTFDSGDEQRKLLRRLLSNASQQIKTDDSVQAWRALRQSILSLCSWSADTRIAYGIFGRIGAPDIESEILRVALSSSGIRFAVDFYGRSPEALPPAQIESIVGDESLRAYDSASNGNQTRGSMKRAAEIVGAFTPLFPQSQSLRQIKALIQATHALSFYALTLQHGVPLRPANLRAQSEPLTLIDRVLDQNTKSYTKLDDLIEIGKNLVRAGLVSASTASKDATKAPIDQSVSLARVERHIIARAIDAALAEDDFDTAYSYVVNRLADTSDDGSTASADKTDTVDNVLWQAAFRAGRHKLRHDSQTHHLRRLEQKMELLSQALLLAPPSAIEKVLAAWQQAEILMNETLAEDHTLDQAAVVPMGPQLPGAFAVEQAPTSSSSEGLRNYSSRGPRDENAPMGLFDVARGAASALGRTAFPLHGSRPGLRSTSTHGHQLSHMDAGADSDRPRRRDMVSDMVTGGLATGIGWVLGAAPVQHEP